MSLAASVVDNPSQERYEISVEGELAGTAQYLRRSRVIALVHTEIDPRFEGRGLAGRLIGFVLDAARAEDLVVLPFCPFVHGYIERHPEYVDLVPADQRADFGLRDATEPS